MIAKSDKLTGLDWIKDHSSSTLENHHFAILWYDLCGLCVPGSASSTVTVYRNTRLKEQLVRSFTMVYAAL